MNSNKPSYHVLIIDDEPHVLEGLRTMIDWKDLGCDKIYFAGSSEDAYKILTEHKVDVLITDIRLPGESGLDLIQSLKKGFDQVKVIVMSGYRDFEYVKRAMTLGVDGYLVKPTFNEDVQEVLKPIIEDMNLHKKRQTYSEESALVMIKDLLVKDEASSLLDTELMDFIKTEDFYLLTCWSKEKDFSYNLVHHCIYEDVPKPFGIILYRDDYGVISLLKKEFHIRWLERVAEFDSELIWEEEHLSGGFNAWKNFYKDFYHALPYLYHLKQGQGILDRRLTKEEDYVGDEKALRNLFKKSIIEDEWGLIQKYTRNLFFLLCQGKRELMLIRKTFVDFYYALLDGLNFMLKKDQDLEAVKQLSQDFYEGTLENLLDLFENRMHRLLEISRQQRSKCKEDIICQVEELMEENMEGHLTLTKIAGIVHLHPAYLGQKLHDQWGESFQRRLNRMRVDRALELLQDDREQGGIETCAYKVGFKNYMTFLKYFKMFKDTTPSKYLNNNRN